MFVLLQEFFQSYVTGFLFACIYQKDRLSLESALVEAHQIVTDKALAVYLLELASVLQMLADLLLLEVQQEVGAVPEEVSGLVAQSPDLYLQTTGRTHPLLALAV
jgi:hypothetical protein